MATLIAQDRETLRRLAAGVAELAARPCEAEKRALWYRHNDLEPTRPLVFCDPENGWHEIIPSDRLECVDGLARAWEWHLRKEIFWGESMGDDRVVEPWFRVGYISAETDWGLREEYVGGSGGGAYTWESPLKSYGDLDKLRFPEITVDYEATDRHLELARELFGDLLEVRLAGGWWWTLGMTQHLIKLRGIEQMMIDMYDDPDGLRALMAFIHEGHERKLDFLEKNNLLSLNNDGSYVGSGGFGYTRQLPQANFDGVHVRPSDMWGFGESQETSTVSPEMFAEFIFPHQKAILSRFGLNCYGCCEPLDKRWHIVREIPNLRRVSVSPWANLEVMADQLGDRHVFSMKPNPADLAQPTIDEDRLRRELRRAIEITRDCRVEIIMKDNHTIGRNPENVKRWCRIAREEAEA